MERESEHTSTSKGVKDDGEEISTVRKTTTRVIFVEEKISEAEPETFNKSFKSFEMETNFHSAKRSPGASEPQPQGAQPGVVSAAKSKERAGDEELSQGKDDNEKRDEVTELGTPPCNRNRKQPSTHKLNKIHPEVNDNKVTTGNVPVRPRLRNHESFESLPSGKGPRPSLRGIAGVARVTSIKAFKGLRAHEELKTIEDSLLYSTLKHLFFWMKMCGIFFIRKKKTHSQGCRGFVVNSSALQWYCGAMCIVLLLNFGRSLLTFAGTSGFDNVLFFKLMVCIFFYESASRAMLAYWACWRKKGGLQELLLMIEDISYPDDIIPYERNLKRWMHVFLVLTIVFSLANAGMTALGMFGSMFESVQALFKEVYLVPLSPDAPGALVFEIFVLIIVYVNGMVALLSLTFYVVFCYILYKEYEYLCRMFMLKVREDGSFADDLEKFRLKHQKRCKLVEAADQIFKYYIANTYLTNIPLLCLLLYSIVYTESEDGLGYRVISTFRLCYVLLQMMVLSVIATMINDHVSC